MVEPASTAVVGAMVWGKAVFNAWRPRKVGIYGAGLTGKTTLDRYMTTPGEMEEIPEEDRTTHFKLLGKYFCELTLRVPFGHTQKVTSSFQNSGNVSLKL